MATRIEVLHYDGHFFGLWVYKARKGFIVEYGKQIKEGLTYEQAIQEIGASMLHDAQCAGKLA